MDQSGPVFEGLANVVEQLNHALIMHVAMNAIPEYKGLADSIAQLNHILTMLEAMNAIPESKDLADTVAQLHHLLIMRGAMNAIPKYEGDPKAFNTWISNIEGYGNHVNANDETTKLFAYQSATGFVSDFIGRYLKAEKEPGTWMDLKTKLESMFGDL